jgi:hypothetical protein
LKTVCAIAPPIIAAAMLSRKRQQKTREQHEAALPVVRQDARQRIRNMTVLEVLREQRESEQQQQQVDQDHPLMNQVGAKAAPASAALKWREKNLVKRNHQRAAGTNRECVLMK